MSRYTFREDWSYGGPAPGIDIVDNTKIGRADVPGGVVLSSVGELPVGGEDHVPGGWRPGPWTTRLIALLNAAHPSWGDDLPDLLKPLAHAGPPGGPYRPLVILPPKLVQPDSLKAFELHFVWSAPAPKVAPGEPFQSTKHPELPPDRIRLNIANPRSQRALAVLADDYADADPALSAALRRRLRELQPPTEETP